MEIDDFIKQGYNVNYLVCFKQFNYSLNSNTTVCDTGNAGLKLFFLN